MSLTVNESERNIIGISTSSRFMTLPLIWAKDIESMPHEVKESDVSGEKKKAQYKGGYNMNESNVLTKLLGRPQL